MQPAMSENIERESKRIRAAGNIVGTEIAELVSTAYLNGIVQQEKGAQRPTHVPLALRPSPFPRAAFTCAVELCPVKMRLLDAVARDPAWLRQVVSPAAEDAEGGDRMALERCLRLLEISEQKIMLGIARYDFMLDGTSGWLKEVETNTISAAFSCAAPRVQRLHRRLLERGGLPGSGGSDTIPVMSSDHGVADGLAAAHKRVALGPEACLLFVVMEQEHLLCESLIEQTVRERHGLRCEVLTMQGAFERLSLGVPIAAETAPTLLLDRAFPISVVYYRGGISANCHATKERWDAREMIERSSAVKCPSAGWLLAGLKIVQSRFAEAETIDRFLPSLTPDTRNKLLGTATRMRRVQDCAAEAEASPSRFVLKKEQGVWAGVDLVEKVRSFRLAGKTARNWFIVDKIVPAPVQNVTFVREGVAIATGPGLQELGVYGVFLGDGESELTSSCAGYLVRTKPEGETDGGVCKGIAVLDSICLVEHVQSSL